MFPFLFIFPLTLLVFFGALWLHFATHLFRAMRRDEFWAFPTRIKLVVTVLQNCVLGLRTQTTGKIALWSFLAAIVSGAVIFSLAIAFQIEGIVEGIP